jgi:O-antigen/teichoic acid export membrane protein
MFPALSSLQDDLVRFRSAYLRMARTITFATFPLIIGLGATAPLFVTTIYGEKWEQAVPVIRLLVVVGFFEGMGTWGTAIWALGKSRITFHLALASLALMTIVFFIGVRWGIVGVATAYIIISPIIFVVPHMLANRLMKLNLGAFLKAIAPPLFASAVMGCAVYLLIARGVHLFTSRWMNLLGFIVIGGVIYIATLLVMAIANRPEQGVFSWVVGQHLTEIETRNPQSVNP